MQSKFNSLLQVLDFFKDEATCKNYIAQQRWGGTVACPHCGSTKVYTTNRGFTCGEKLCAKKFSVTSGTIFENTKISLRVWIAAMYLCTAHKKGISSLQLSRDLNITQKTAWFLLHRIREMLVTDTQEQLTGTVEVDETYVGGKKINKHKSVRAKLKDGTGYVNKTPIVAMLQRDGTIVTVVSPIANGDTIKPFIYKHVAPGATVITDGFSAYTGLDKTYTHEVVNHTDNEYVRGTFHTNNIEGFWSQLKRGIIGIYHQVSPKHLHRYAHEFGYKYNTRKQLDTVRFEQSVGRCNGIRLRYSDLIKDV